MPADNSPVTIDDVYKLLAELERIDMGFGKLFSALVKSNSILDLAIHLRGESVYPLMWGKPKHYLNRTEGRFKTPVWAEVGKTGLSFKVCADCGTHVWVSIGTTELHISKRSNNFVQLTDGLQVRPDATGLLVRQPLLQQAMAHCLYSAD